MSGIDKEILEYPPSAPQFFVEAGGNEGNSKSNTCVLGKTVGMDC